MTTKTVEPWGANYQKRVGKTGGNGAECCVCGRQTNPATALYVAASPATGTFRPATEMGTPDGDRYETSGYPIGPECAKVVRAAHPASFARV
jgi:hypothetical protein